jgi:hypothetical protein
MRVILTTDETDKNGTRGHAFFERTGYVGVYDIADLECDTKGLTLSLCRPLC